MQGKHVENSFGSFLYLLKLKIFHAFKVANLTILKATPCNLKSHGFLIASM